MAVDIRVAVAADQTAVVETIASSFFVDPVWSWIFPDPSTRLTIYRRWWPAFVRGALQYDWLRVTPGCEAIALWLPPGGAEFTAQDQATFDALIEECSGPRADLVREAFAQFELHGPKDREFHYLSVFGTHADHRGQGLGMALLAENLADLDAAGSPAYLESTNPANLQRYRSVGFESVEEFFMPQGGPLITTMWRKPRT